MSDRTRFPRLDEFWRRLEERGLETDLIDTLRDRAARERLPTRLPAGTVVAFVERILPDTIPATAIAVFIDEHYDRQLGRADEKAGVLPREELIPAGFRALDDHARHRGGTSFGDLPPEARDELIAEAEKGDLAGPEGFDSATWFRRTRALALLGLGSDPRGMVFMGFPGPSYQTGHVWLDQGEVEARAKRRPGHRTL